MKRLTFKRQIILGIILIIVGNMLAFVFHNGIFSNIVWIAFYHKSSLSRTIYYRKKRENWGENCRNHLYYSWTAYKVCRVNFILRYRSCMESWKI